MPTVDNEIILRTQDKIVDGDLIPQTRPSPRERPLHFRSVLYLRSGEQFYYTSPDRRAVSWHSQYLISSPSRADWPMPDCPFRGDVISTLLFIQIWLQSVIILFITSKVMPPIKQVVACDVNQSTENEMSWEW